MHANTATKGSRRNGNNHTSTSLFLLPSRRQTTHPKVIANFNTIANHILEAMPVVLESPPAVMAPENNARNAPIRRFRFGLSFAVSLGSTRRSHKSVVTTTVGISSSARIREAHIWPPAWNDKSEIGRTCIHSIGARGSSGFGVITPSWMRIAVARRAKVWMPNEIIIVERRRGFKIRCKWIKKILLPIKTEIAIKDLAQRYAG
jgi:hypothetical protein